MTLSRKLDALPLKDGFRMRGMDMTRTETFTDAAFAFALTLLVVSLDVPGSYEELIAALKGIPAFALSGSLLMIFWAGHHTWSRRYGLEDMPSIFLSCLLVFTVLVYVYPLRFMFSAMMSWIGHLVGLPLFQEPIRMQLHQLNKMSVAYGCGFVAMCTSLVLLNRHAWKRRDDLRLNSVERWHTKAEIGAWLIVGSSGLLSILLALTTPPNWIGLPGWAYALLAVVMPLYSRQVERRRPPSG